MKNRFIILTVLMFMFFSSDLSARRKVVIGNIADLNYSTKEITVKAPDAGHKVKMGDILYVKRKKKIIKMKATFPMQTITRCVLLGKHRKYFSKLKKGMMVYKYFKGVEKKKKFSKAAFYRKGKCKLKVKSTHKARIFIIDHASWELLIKIYMVKNGYEIDTAFNIDSERLKKLTIEYIMQGMMVDGKLNFIYYQGNTGKYTNHTFKKIAKGQYYIWVVGNNIISHKYFTLNKKKATVKFNLKKRRAYISSDPPGAEILLGSNSTGKMTPAKVVVPIEKPSCSVTLKKDGYYNYNTDIYVRQGVVKRKHYVLEKKEYGKFNITSSPSDASVYVDGKYEGTAPLTVTKLTGKDYPVRASKGGYETRYVNSSVRKNRTTYLDFDLPLIMPESHFSISLVGGYFDSDNFRDYYKYFGGFEITKMFSVFDDTIFWGYYGFSVVGSVINSKINKETRQDRENLDRAYFCFVDPAFGLGLAPSFGPLRIFLGAGIKVLYLYENAVLANNEFSNRYVGFTYEYKASLVYMLNSKTGIQAGLRMDDASFYYLDEDEQGHKYSMNGIYASFGIVY